MCARQNGLPIRATKAGSLQMKHLALTLSTASSSQTPRLDQVVSGTSVASIPGELVGVESFSWLVSSNHSTHVSKYRLTASGVLGGGAVTQEDITATLPTKNLNLMHYVYIIGGGAVVAETPFIRSCRTCFANAISISSMPPCSRPTTLLQP